MRKIIIALFIIGASACSGLKNKTNHTATEEALPDPSTMHFDMQKRGVDFYAQAEDGAWELEIDYENKVKFSAKDLKNNFEVNVLTLGKGLRGSEAIHEVKNKDGELTVEIKKSEAPFKQTTRQGYTVGITYLDLKTKTETKYNGRGGFYGVIQLHDIWLLDEINGEKVDVSNLHKLPNMEIHLDKEKVMGFLGCNNFSSEIYFGRQQISFNYIMSTKMACSGSDVEQRFSKIISNKTLNYKFDGLYLILENDTEKLIFKKGD